MKKHFRFLPIAIFVIAFCACKKENGSFTSAKISDYFPLETGKYITYHLDSIVYISFGTRDTTISYEAKYVVDSLIYDNIGRPGYRIFRFLRKTATDTWEPSGTFMAIDTKASLEYIENNMRFIKMELPIENNYSWKGNVYIDATSLNSEVKYLDDWDYVYDSVAVPVTVGTFNLDDVITVHERDEIVGIPSDPTAYSEVNYSQAKYARGIGLVYRSFFHNEHQPDATGGPGYFADGSYGITMTMIDHN